MPMAARKVDKVLCTAKQAPGTGTFTVVTGDTAKVKIGNAPAVCLGDTFTCTGANPPASSPTPCTSGKVAKGSATVKIGNKPASRMGDDTLCTGTGATGKITSGEATVMIGG